MREILFRGKRVDNGERVEGFYVRLDGKEHRIYTGYAETDCGDYYPDWWQVEPETVGQYTGLKDKNGKKIFDGDIIRADNGKESSVSVVCYGEFSPRMFYDLLEIFVRSRPKEKLVGLFIKSTKNNEEMFLSNCSKLIEVIGNIHDNPELLKGE